MYKYNCVCENMKLPTTCIVFSRQLTKRLKDGKLLAIMRDLRTLSREESFPDEGSWCARSNTAPFLAFQVVPNFI